MEIQVTGKNIELLPKVRDYVTRKLDKVNRLLPKVFAFDVEIAEEKTRSPQQHFIVQVTINNNGTLLRGEERGQDMFTAIDKVAEVMARQVEHYKGKKYEKGRGGTSIRVAEANIPAAEATAETSPEPTVVRTKRFNIKPMSLEEAIAQMELLGHDFFLFRNSENEEINLLYRRKDGNYGIIEVPVK